MKKCYQRFKWLLVIISLFFLFEKTSNAATNIPLSVVAPVKISSCQSNSFSLKYVSPGNHNFSMYAKLTGTGNFNTLCDSAVLHPNVFIIIDSLINASAGSLTVDTVGLNHDCKWTEHLSSVSGDMIKIKFRIFIDCANLSDSTGSISNSLLKLIFTDTTNVYDFKVNGGTSDSLSANVSSPYLLNTSPSAYNVYYHDTLSALFTYVNSGAADANISFIFNPHSGNSCLNSPFSLQRKDSTSGSFTNFTAGVPTSAFIKKGESLVIRQKQIINSCYKNCGSDTVTFIWQCNLLATSGIFCTECQNVDKHPYTFVVKDTNIVNFVLTQPFPNSAPQWDLTCLNDSANMQEWIYMITKPDQGGLDSIYIDLYSSRDFPNELAIVPPSSFFIDTTHCRHCNVHSQVVTSAASLCDSYYSVTLDTGKATATNFKHGDTLYVHYKIFRCAEENDGALMNAAKFYNYWDISVDPKTICGKRVHNGNGSASGFLDLDLFYLPSTADLNVEKGHLFGEKATFTINLNRLLEPGNVISSLLGCGSDTCLWDGYLRAKIHCDTNLIISRPDSQIFLTLFDTASLTDLYRYPVYYYFNIDTANCFPGDYFFYFNLHDSLTQQIINHGQFSFELQACCKIDAGSTPYKVSFHLLANPRDPDCISLTFPTIGDTIPPTCSGFGCSWIPLSSVEDDIQVHCPGCMAPGIIVDGYNMSRESYGYQDNDNDSRADSSLIQIADTSAWYLAHKRKIIRNTSSFGDRITERLKAHFEPGSSSGGYTYAQMQAGGAYLNHIQLYRTMPGSIDSIKLMISDLIFYIDEPNTSSPNCRSCAEFGIDTTKFRTQLEIHVSGANIFQYFLDTLTSGGKYLFTFSSIHTSANDTGNLHNNLLYDSYYKDPVDSFLTFFEGQRYRLKVNYKECGMFPKNPGYTNDYLTYLKKVKIFNKMALTGKKKSISGFEGAFQMPNDTGAVRSFHYVVNPADTISGDTLINSIFAGKFIFYCETYGGLHYFFTDEIVAGGSLYFSFLADYPQYRDTGCTIILDGYGYDIIANRTFDLYPFEYRPALLAPVEYKFAIPSGYYVDTVYTRTRFSYRNLNGISNLLGISHPAYPNDTLVFTSGNLPPLRCLPQNVKINGNNQPVSNVSDFNQYMGDQKTQRQIFVVCKAFSCPDTSYRYNPNTIIVKIDTSINSCYSLQTCGLDSSFKGIISMPAATPPVIQGKDIVIWPNIQIADSTGDAYKEQFCTKLTFTNPHHIFGNFNNSVAFNVYLIVPDSASVPYLTGWTFTVGNTVYPINNNGVIKLKKIMGVSETIAGYLCANFSNCHYSPHPDSIRIYYGWDCKKYPDTIPLPDSICSINSFYIPFEQSTATISTDGKIPPPEYNLCDTFQITIPYRSTNFGGIRPDSILLAGIPSNLLITGIYIANASGQKTPISPAVLANMWKISASNLFSLGYLDTLLYSPPYTEMDLIIKAIPQCRFNGDPISSITLFAHNFCGDTISLPTSCSPYIIDPDGNPKCSDCFTIIKTALVDTIEAFDTTGFMIIVCGYDNNVSTWAQISETLPPDFTPTSTIPDSVLVPAFSCDTFYVYGYFSTSGPSVGHDHINEVEVTSTSGTVIDTASIGVSEPCQLSYNIFIKDASYISSFTGTYSFTGDSVYIEGLLYIDQNVTFTNCKVYMASGAQIIVQANNAFVLDSTFIIGCHDMWRGIFLEPGNTAIDVSHRSLIADADTGIYVPSIGYLGVRNSAILNSVHGVYIEPSPGELKYFTVEIYGSRFGMTDTNTTFKPDFTGQNAHGPTPYACIEENDIIMDVGDASQDSNYFYRANFGIVAQSSYSTFINNKFERIYKDTLYHPWYGGSAIVGYGDLSTYRDSRLTVLPLTSHSPTVDNSLRGIYTHYSRLIVDSTDFRNVRVGVYTEKCTKGLVTRVTNCKINATGTGLRWRLNAGASSMFAADNTITMGGDTTGTGISLYESGGTANYYIQSNRITLNSAKRGIHSQAAFKPVIIFNTIYQNKISAIPLTYGIKLEKSDSAKVGCNRVISTDTTSQVSWGYYINQSQDGQVLCNSTSVDYKGIFFGGQCGATVFNGNAMDYNFWGLELNSTAKIGPQDTAGNMWTGYRDSIGAINWGSVSFSLFKVNGTMGSSSYFPVIPTWNSGWFTYIPGSTPFACGAAPCTDWIETHDEAEDDYLRSVANNEDLTSDFIPESKNMAKHYLFGRLSNDSVLLASDTVFSDFFVDNVADNIGKMFQVSEKIKTVSSFDINTNQLTLFSDKATDSLMAILNTLDSLSIANPNVNYSSQINNVTEQINSIQDTISNLNSQKYNSEIQTLDSASILNNSFISAEIPENNEQFISNMYSLYLKYGKDTLLFYFNDILAIALQCPFSGGGAVFKARTFVSLFNETLEYDDSGVCLQAGYFRKQKANKNNNYQSEIIITPNPAQDKISITLNYTLTGICKIEILDAIGSITLLDEMNCNEKNHTISTKNLKPGAYFVKVYGNSINPKNTKLIISR